MKIIGLHLSIIVIVTVYHPEGSIMSFIKKTFRSNQQYVTPESFLCKL